MVTTEGWNAHRIQTLEELNMSTNSRIGILHEDGTTETIYCHWDGYPEHQMPILTEHYNTEIGRAHV